MFTAWENRKAAAEICERCAVRDRCRQEPEKARQEQGLELVGIWGGRWMPLTLPDSIYPTRELALRILAETAVDGTWRGDPRRLTPPEGRTERETYCDGKTLQDTGFLAFIGTDENGNQVWRTGGLPAPWVQTQQETWETIVNSVDDNGNFRTSEITGTGMGREEVKNFHQSLQQLARKGVVEQTSTGAYRIDLLAAGA